MTLSLAPTHHTRISCTPPSAVSSPRGLHCLSMTAMVALRRICVSVSVILAPYLLQLNMLYQRPGYSI